MQKTKEPEFPPRYQIINRLGEGGIATVYQVEDLRDGTVKALKALKYDGRRNVRRFEEEYRILSSLHHPNLPEAFDYGIAPGGVRYIVMEYIHGVPVDKYASSRPSALWFLLYQLVESLAFIHEHGLLHLDLKPANILVRSDQPDSEEEKPSLVLIDFGVSHRRDAGGQFDQVGTPGYMPPEIIRGETILTRAADYYSLGITLYELTHGRVPYTGTFKQVLNAHLRGEMTFDEQKVEFTELYAHIRKLTQREPRARLEAFEDFRRSLAARVAGKLEGMEKEYGLGYLNSLGIIGKKDLWNDLLDWVGHLTPFTSPQYTPPKDARGPEPTAFVDTHDGDVVRTTIRVDEPRYQLMEASGGKYGHNAEEGHVRSEPRLTRSIIISGANGSGKSFVIQALNAELLMSGLNVVMLNEVDDFKSLVPAQGIEERVSKDTSVAPESIIIDRFVRGWEKLMSQAGNAGVVVIVDGYEAVSKEVSEFFSYICTRVELGMNEGMDAKVFFIVTSCNPQVKRDLDDVLPHGGTNEYLIPPPVSSDVEAMLEMFSGHMVRVENREALRQYVSEGGETVDALVARLKAAFVRGDLVRSGGKWDFLPGTADAHDSKEEHASYYHVLFETIGDEERTLIKWLCANMQHLYFDDLKALCGFSREHILRAIQRVRPFRVIDHFRDEHGDRVGFVSEAVRKAFYRSVGKADRKTLHTRYVEYFSRKPAESKRHYKLLSHHYEQAGMYRSALCARVLALKDMRRRNDIFGIRQLCNDGIEAVHKLRGAEWHERKWHIERFFLKQWMNTEWMLRNYAGVVDIIKTNILAKRRSVPVSFSYKYGVALEKLGHLAACRRAITAGKRRLSSDMSKPFHMLSLLEASLCFTKGDYVGSLKILDLISPAQLKLDPWSVARIYVLYMLNYEGLGNKHRYDRYVQLAESIAGKTEDFEQLLTVHYSRIMSDFNSSLYEKAKSSLKESIRLAHKHRFYDKLGAMYFLASAVYFEEGSYRRGLRYLDKAVRVSVNLGMTQRVTDYTLRYAFIYQNMGNYGNAIRFAETARRQASEHDHNEQYFLAVLILFDLHISLRNNGAESYVKELMGLLGNVVTKHRLAFFHSLMGEYYINKPSNDEAMQEFKIACKMYESIQYEDDAARCLMKIAVIHARNGDGKRAFLTLQRVDQQVYRMESENLNAECYMAHLNYHVLVEQNPEKYTDLLRLCEKVRPKISDINVAMKMDVLLSVGYREMGVAEKELKYLASYRDSVNDIVSSLPDENYVNQYLSSHEVSEVLAQYEEIKKKNSERVPV
ncbi:MAG: protein kinase [Candidatus Krumholzibacteriota bacterium]|nr:protein kinase [Candidatus Krumholzibacteriota bacterium]